MPRGKGTYGSKVGRPKRKGKKKSPWGKLKMGPINTPLSNGKKKQK